MSEQKMNIGILGAARIAAGSLIPAVHKSVNARVAGVAARDLARANEFAAEHNIPKTYGSYQEMLADPEIDAVYNPLPNNLHSSLSVEALQAGKHVLCEKPFAMNVAEATQILEVAKKNNLVAMEGFMYRFHPQIAQAQAWIAAGKIGELKLIRPSFGFFLDEDSNIRWVKELGGGALYDVGCYCVNISRTFAGREPTRVYGAADWTDANHAGGGGVDHAFAGILEFGDGLRSSFDCSFSQSFRQRLELVGTTGSIVLTEPYVPGRDKNGGDAKSGHGSIAPTLLLNGETVVGEINDQYQSMVEHFVRAARGQEQLRFGPDESVRQMRVLDALFESDRKSLPVIL